LVGKIVEVKSSNGFLSLVTSTPMLLVDIYTTWCIPCKWMSEALEKLFDELSEIGFKIAKANAEELDIGRVMDELRLEPIRGVLTLLIFKNGKEVGRVIGSHPKPHLSEVYTDLRDIQNKTQYLVNSGSLKDETAKGFLNDIVNRLKRYSTWFEKLRNKTLTQKLRSVDEVLSAHLHRLYEFSRNSLNSKDYLITRLRVLLEIVNVVIEEIDGFMRGEILPFSLKKRKLRKFEEAW